MVEQGGGDPQAASGFGHYRLIRLLGTGTFGEVHEAADTVNNRQVALKLIGPPHRDDPEFRARLFGETARAGRLTEPHIVPVHGCGEIDGRLYIEMPLVRGTDLAAVLAGGGPLSPQRAVAIVGQIAAALDAAHAVGLTHRGVAPASIMLTAEDFACLLDFGLSAAEVGPADTGAPGGFGYLAPERLSPGAPVGPAADVYALTCVLHECLTGAPPYAGDPRALAAAHLAAPPPRPSLLHPWLPAGIDTVIARGMAKDPGARYPTAGELARAAHAALIGGFPGAAPPRPAARGRGRRVVLAVAALAVLTAAAIGGVFALTGHDSAPPEAAPPETVDPCEQAQPFAEEFAELVTTTDYRTFDEQLAEVLDNSTGDFKEQFTAASEQLRPLLEDAHSVAQGRVRESAVQSCADDTAVVLLVVDQTVTSNTSPEPQLKPATMKITLQWVDGRWLASDVAIQ